MYLVLRTAIASPVGRGAPSASQAVAPRLEPGRDLRRRVLVQRTAMAPAASLTAWHAGSDAPSGPGQDTFGPRAGPLRRSSVARPSYNPGRHSICRVAGCPYHTPQCADW